MVVKRAEAKRCARTLGASLNCLLKPLLLVCSGGRCHLSLLLAAAWLLAEPAPSAAAGTFTTNTYNFTYGSREDLLADGWSFIATTPTGLPRNTEVTNPAPAAVSYDQTNHPEVLRIPAGAGFLYSTNNGSANSLLRNLSSNWVSVRLEVAAFQPTANYQQVRLALYQDDDNYLDIGRGYNSTQGGQAIQFVREEGVADVRYSPMILGYTNVSATAFRLRLDRDLGTDAVTGYYSLDGTNWVSVAGSSQPMMYPRLCIWVGASSTLLPNCDLRRLDVVVSDQPLIPLLVAQPQHLVFHAAAGQACTNLQQVRVIARRALNPVSFSVATNAPWILADASSADTNTPGAFDVSVNTAGLPAGTYEQTVVCSAPGAAPASVTVTLIVNPASRAEVSTWRGGKAGAMTVWIDDAQTTAFDTLSTNGLRGTYVIDETFPIPYFFTNYYLAGMELGSHTVTHPCPQRWGETRTRFELETNITDICARTPQPRNTLISFAYPCGLTTNVMQAVAGDYLLVARGYNINQLEDASPYNLMNLKSFNSHENDPHLLDPLAPPNPADFKTIVNAAVAQGKWFNLVLHTMVNDDGAIVYSLGKDIWVGTAGAVTKYILQRDRTVITNVVETTNTISFTCYRLPLDASGVRSFETAIEAQDALTFAVDLAGISSISRVSVNGTSVPFSSKTSGGKTNLLVDLPVTATAQTVVLQISNSAPVLPAQPDRGAGALSPLVVTNTATDRDVPVQGLTYSLVSPPAGAQIDTNGVIRWTPDASQLTNSYLLTTVVKDAGQPQLSATNSFNVTVKYLLTVTASNQSRTYGATNPVLTGTLVGVRAGDGITATYTTTATSGSPVGTYAITPSLNDPNGKLPDYFAITNNGTLTISRADSLLALTASTNAAPVGSNVTFWASLSAAPPGSGTPGGSVQFLVDNSAFGAAAPVTAGLATLTTSSLTRGYHAVEARYSGDGSFNASSNVLSGSLLIWTNIPLVITNVTQKQDKNLEFTGVGIPEQRYRIQAATDLVNWATIATNLSGTNGVVIYLDPDATNYPRRFYRTLFP
jgi:hypothetical protein